MTWLGTTDSSTGILRIQTYTTKLTITYILNAYTRGVLGAYWPSQSSFIYHYIHFSYKGTEVKQKQVDCTQNHRTSK